MSTTKIKADIQELKLLNNSIAKCAEQLREYRQRKKQLEESIFNYMQHSEQPLNTIKMQDVEIVTIEKKFREKLKKDEKENTAVQLLQQSGVSNPRKTFKDLQEMMKGNEKTQKVLKVMSPAQAANMKSKKQHLK